MTLIKKTFNDLISNPVVILYSFSILFFLILLDTFVFIKVGEFLNGKSELIHYVWLIIYVLIQVLIISLFLTLILNRFFVKKNTFNENKSLFFKNAIFIFIFMLGSGLIYLVNKFAFDISQSISLSYNLFYILTLIIQYGGIFLLTFIALPSFFLMKENLGLIDSLTKSIKFVKSKPIVFIVFILFSLLLFLLSFIPQTTLFLFSLEEIIRYAVLYPILISILANIIKD